MRMPLTVLALSVLAGCAVLREPPALAADEMVTVPNENASVASVQAACTAAGQDSIIRYIDPAAGTVIMGCISG